MWDRSIRVRERGTTQGHTELSQWSWRYYCGLMVFSTESYWVTADARVGACMYTQRQCTLGWPAAGPGSAAPRSSECL